ncbi:MAG: PDZ domain-containing protein [Gemmatimonas sp.]|jgi:carboxyl-terminal processing protease|uniref:S41 family peptidase n=1 Tax=Gemmatimonas sp. TaxID=1962908 RepID=UPI0031BFCECD|nr:PDZ domain-containing protein [Gemmatimonas sp.]
MVSFRSLTRPRVLAPLTAVAVAAAFAGGRWYERVDTERRDEWADAKLLSTAIDSVRANALDSLPSEELIRRAVSGMLRELQDPYAALLRPDGFEKYRGTLKGDGQGLGLTLRREPRGLGVARVAPGSPAEAAGIRAGDRILAENGVAMGDDARRASARTNGNDRTRAANADVVLTLWRAPMGDTVQLSVKRTKWHLPAVSDQGLLADSVGYVRLSTISARSSYELERAVEGVIQRGARALVLDLRGNTGGLFEEGVRAAGLFLPRGAVVASLVGRGGTNTEPYRTRDSRWSTLPLTVLVDARTASAAEVIAAALRDHGRALLVGTPTYGKGLVQRVVRLSPDLSLRLTTARWLTPRGVSLERRAGKGAAAHGGLLPDVLLDEASRRDPYSVPDGWSAPAGRAVALMADSLAMHALREGWVVRPLPLLEGRLRTLLAQRTPATERDPLRRAEWVTTATRLAMVRMLEVERERDALLRYAVREDAALRAGLDVVAPGAEVAQLHPEPLPPLPSRRALGLRSLVR